MIRESLECIIRIPLLALAVLIAGTSHARIIGQDDKVPVASLATNDPIRQTAQPAGLLRSVLSDGSVQTCITAIISDRHILTAAPCVFGAENATAVFGQRRADLKVVGLHHWGFVVEVDKWSKENRAVQISLIKKRLGFG